MKSRQAEPALPGLERRLATAAAERMKESRQSLGRRVIGFRGSRIAAAGVACMAFGGSAVAAGVWNPGIGSHAPTKEEAPRTLSNTPVPTAATEVLGVLRREQTARDRSAEVEATLGEVSFVDRVRPDSVRFLAPGARGKATILLSAETSLETKLSKDLGEAAGEEAVCVFRPDPVDYGHPSDLEQGCFSLSELVSGRGYGEDLHPGRGIALGVVPDGVASVTAEFADAPDITVPVNDNYFEISLGEGKGDLEAGVQRVVWHDADGKVVPQLSNGADTGTPAWRMVGTGG